jgi:hypothetical protein
MILSSVIQRILTVLLIFHFCSASLAESSGVASSSSQKAIMDALTDTGADPVMNETYPSMSANIVPLACVDGIHTLPANSPRPPFGVLRREKMSQNPITGNTKEALGQFNSYLNLSENKRLKDFMDAISTFGNKAVYASAELILLYPGFASSITSDVVNSKTHKQILKGWKKSDGPKAALEQLGHTFHSAIDHSTQQTYCPHRLPLLLKACNQAFDCKVLFHGKDSADVLLTSTQIDAVAVKVHYQSKKKAAATAAHAVDALENPTEKAQPQAPKPKKTNNPNSL